MIGLLTPPVGLCAYIVSDLAEVPFEGVVKELITFIAILMIVLLVITYVPEITMYLPNLFLNK